MDLWAAGDHKHADGSNVNAFDYGDTFRDFITRSSYYLGPNGKPFVTTFSDGGMNNDSFIGWRETLSSTGVYFVPDLDHTLGLVSSLLGCDILLTEIDIDLTRLIQNGGNTGDLSSMESLHGRVLGLIELVMVAFGLVTLG